MSTQGIGSQPSEASALDLSDKTLILPKTLQLPIGTDFTKLGAYNPQTYAGPYLVGSGGDDTSYIQAAINAAQAAGGGRVTLWCTQYNIKSTLNITASNVEIVGMTAGGSIISAGAAAAFHGINVAGTDNGGGRIYHVTLRNFTMQQTAAPSTGFSAIKAEYVVLLKLQDLIISQWGCGVNITGTTDFYADRVYITSANATAANVYGFFIDGTVQNASVFLSHCIAAHGSYAGAGFSYSYYVTGTDISDLYMHFCESDSSSYGLFVSPSGSGFDILDIHLYQFVADQHTTNCIAIENMATDSGMIRIDGGWCSPGASNMNAVYAASASGIVINGLQMYALAARTGCTAINLASACDNFVIRDCVIKNFQSGIATTGGSLGTISGNKLYATSAQGGTAISTTTPKLSISDNTIGGVASGWANGIYLGAGADYVSVNGNNLDAASITGSVIHNDTGNPHTMIANNPGFNPLGGAVAQPTVGASPWTYTNNTGVMVTLYVTSGTVSSIVVDGKTTGMVSGAFRVPPGKTAVLTYSAAPTVVAVGD